MTDAVFRTITSTVHEWELPAGGTYGANIAELSRAINQAERVYRSEFGIHDGAAIPDNALSFRPGDGSIIISMIAKTEVK